MATKTDLNTKELAVLRACREAPSTLSDIAKRFRRADDDTQANSWARNSVRPLDRLNLHGIWRVTRAYQAHQSMASPPPGGRSMRIGLSCEVLPRTPPVYNPTDRRPKGPGAGLLAAVPPIHADI